MSQADLLQLLELAHPGRPEADLLAMIEATPDSPGARPAGKPREGRSRPAGIYQPPRPQRPPQRALAIERRRRLASSGPLPPSIACRFTVSEQAILRIIGDECREKGACLLHMDAIAARAGTCRKMVQITIRKAAREGLLEIHERRRPGQPNLTNVLKVASREWKAWLDRGPSTKKIGGKNLPATDTKIQNKGFRREEAAQAPGQAHPNKAHASPRAYTTPEGIRLRDQSGVAGGATKGGLPSVQRGRVHGNARLRGA